MEVPYNLNLEMLILFHIFCRQMIEHIGIKKNISELMKKIVYAFMNKNTNVHNSTLKYEKGKSGHPISNVPPGSYPYSNFQVDPNQFCVFFLLVLFIPD
jgi:hypothetical protein